MSRADGCVCPTPPREQENSRHKAEQGGEKSQRLYVPLSSTFAAQGDRRRHGRRATKGRPPGVRTSQSDAKARATPPQGDAGVPARRPRTQSRGVHRGGECLCDPRIFDDDEREGRLACVGGSSSRVSSHALSLALSRPCVPLKIDDVGARGLTLSPLLRLSPRSDLR